MLLLLLACAPAPDDTGETGVPSEWASTRIAPEAFVAAADGFAVGEEGRVVTTDSTWADLGGAADERFWAADAREGSLVALTSENLAVWDGEWRTTALPRVGQDVAITATGPTYVLATHMDCDDCKGAVVANDLMAWDGAWTMSTATLAEDWLYALTELDDGTLVGVGTDVASWNGDWTWENLGGYTLWDVVADGSEILAVGDAGTVVRGVPGTLTTETVGTEDLVAAAVDDGTAWVLGGTSAWYDAGAGWTEVPLPDGTWIGLAVSTDGVFVLGDDAGPVGLAWDGASFVEAWREVALPLSNAWIDEDGTAWTVGEGRVGTWSGDGELTAWTMEHGYTAIAGSASDDVVAVGNDTIAEWDGAAWTETAWETEGMLWDVAVAPDGAAFIGGGGWGEDESQWAMLVRRTEDGWVEETDLPVTANALLAVEAFAEDDVYALTWGGEAALLRWDGASWEVLAEGLTGDPTVLWGRSGDDLYLGGEGLWHWDGSSVTEVTGAPGGVLGLAGDDDAVLVAGTDGWGDDWAPVVSIYEGGAWTELFRDPDPMYVGAGSGTRVALVGRDGWRED